MSTPMTSTPKLEELTKGDVIAEQLLDVTRADLIRYAGASGDYNPIHWSQTTAEQVGLPGVIAHGMLSMGLVVDVVSQWCGDPARIIDYQTRFTAMLPVAETTQDSNPAKPFDEAVAGAQLQVSAKIAAIKEEDAMVRVDLTVTDPNGNDAKVLSRTQVLVDLSPRA